MFRGHAAALRVLLADPRTDISVTSNTLTLLGITVTCCNIPCLDVLLQDGRFDITGPMSVRHPHMTCLHGIVAGQGDKVPMLRRLLQLTHGRLSVDVDGGRGGTPLGLAISSEWVEGARVLIEEGGADPLRRDALVR